MNRKQEIIAQIVTLLSQLIEGEENAVQTVSEQSAQTIEMLTIKECAEAVKGLSEHTIRQLVAQEKIPHIRTGQGRHGKILISRAALLEYLGGAA